MTETPGYREFYESGDLSRFGREEMPEQREVTLDCPSDCAYLQQARDHEKPRS